MADTEHDIEETSLTPEELQRYIDINKRHLLHMPARRGPSARAMRAQKANVKEGYGEVSKKGMVRMSDASLKPPRPTPESASKKPRSSDIHPCASTTCDDNKHSRRIDTGDVINNGTP